MRHQQTLAFIFTFFVFMATARGQGISVGPKVGINISNFRGGVDSKALVGLHFGGLVNFGIGKVFSIQPEALFSRQGATINDGIKKIDFRASYVNVPVMLKFGGNNGGFYFEIGPQFGCKISENVEDKSIGKFAKQLDMAAAAGLGVQSSIGLGIGARYVLGFSKVGDFDRNNIDPDFKHSIIQVSIFWALGGS